jgi:hypothetical protein
VGAGDLDGLDVADLPEVLPSVVPSDLDAIDRPHGRTPERAAG